MVFTRDLRVIDNPALVAACQSENVSCLFVLDNRILASSTSSPKRVQFLHEALHDLRSSIEERQAHLEIREGEWLKEVCRYLEETLPQHVHIADDHSSYAKNRLNLLETWCESQSIALHRHPGVTVVEPGAVQPGSGGEYKVFTPYWRAWSLVPKRAVLPAPKTIGGSSSHEVVSHSAQLHLDPGITKGGESHGQERLSRWLRDGIARYGGARDFPAIDGTSSLSPYLHFGCISPLQVVILAQQFDDSEAFIRQVVWRDFYAQILDFHPEASQHDYRSRGDDWVYCHEEFQAWVNGTTGFPLVDAGMRQLKSDGLMHNRVRMVTASFLIKDLHQDWRRGARYFMSQLIDGDVASNYLNWQWVAGTGTDANPHRILNPATQAKRFDPTAVYIRKWVPELAELSPMDALDPTSATRALTGYPQAIVDHRERTQIFKQRRSRS